MSFKTTGHGTSALPIRRYLKPPQVQPFLDATCSLTFCLWLTGTKLENKGNHWPIMAVIAKMLNVLTTITRLEKKYYCTKQSPHTEKSHGLSLQFIQMELSGFNAEPKRNDLLSKEYNHLQIIFYKLGKIYVRPISSNPLSPTITKSYVSLIVMLSLHLQWPPGLWRLILFWIKDFSAQFSRLTASFVGASVIGHGIMAGNIAC